MKDLKKYIQENRSVFEDKEPLSGHQERFEEKLNSSLLPKRSFYLKYFSIAASILLILGIGAGWFLLQPSSSETIDIHSINLNYQNKMLEQITLIECKLESADSDTKELLESDLEHLKKENEKFIRTILENDDNELIRKYMEQHYEINLQVLQTINSKLGQHFKC